MITDDKHIQLLRTSSSTRSTARRLQRLARTGALTRIRPGVFAAPDRLVDLDAVEWHVLRLRAVLPRLPPGAMPSHLTAAALYGWPHIGSWPERVHVTDQTALTDRQRDGLTVHRALDGAIGQVTHVFDGLSVLPMAATAVELARALPMPESLVILDHLLRTGSVTRDAVEHRVERTREKGRGAVARVVGLASGRRESVGESYCAARMVEIGAPSFEEQHEFRHADGTMDRVDFWLPDLGIVVEFDGRQKYEDPTMRGGRDAPDVLWDEKRREDRIRRRPEVHTFIRVRWWHLVDPDRLRALFREHGVRLAVRPAGLA
ncbi:hypothetical protein [Curtobacterium sp. RRHDQ10]|uniref:hypothetical protein n=1 Tax=Curtobacterium phyllosphaerae TaxID=3413379 RepID=UPI003BF12A3F